MDEELLAKVRMAQEEMLAGDLALLR